MRQPDRILDSAANTLDFDRPVAIMLLGILNFIIDDGHADAIVHQLLAGVPSGSFLVISHPTTEVHGAEMSEAVRLWNSTGGAEMRLRDRAGVARFFQGLDVLEPGVVSCSRWRSDSSAGVSEDVSHYGGVGRKP